MDHNIRICNNITNHDKINNSKELYKSINSISGKYKKSTTSSIKKSDGNIPTDENELMETWKTYFENLFSLQNKNINFDEIPEAPNIDLPINTNDFTEQEFDISLNSLSNRITWY